MKAIRRKFRAILDIITTDKFLLVTFKKDNSVDWFTEFNIKEDQYINELFK